MTLPALRDLIDQHFTDAELRLLCYDLAIEYENLPGEIRVAKAQALVEYCRRHNHLPELGNYLLQLRPSIEWPDLEVLATDLTNVQTAIDAQEKLVGILPEEQLTGILTSLHQKKSELLTQLIGRGTIAQGEGTIAIGEQGVFVDGNVDGDINTGQQVVVTVEEGATFVMGAEAKSNTSFDHNTALNRYLAHIIAHNRYLQLQGVHSGGRLVHIELEQIYITLRATQQRTRPAEERWVATEAEFAPGERQRTPHGGGSDTMTETVTVSVNEALATHRRLVVLGDPGSGKTTLLRYLALLYARDLAKQAGIVKTLLSLTETGLLPILLPLRQLGAFLGRHSEASTEGHRLLLDFLQQYLENERINVPLQFFDPYLGSGQAVVLLDGMDEVAGSDLRRRVARLIESFTRAYPNCRYVVTSRIVGYIGAARLGEQYNTTTVQDFTLADIEKFLSYWHRLVLASQMGAGKPAEYAAQRQTQQLLAAIRINDRIRELAINPLLLTVIALVHRDRVKLPDRRAELYAEAIAVLLGKWDEARGVLPAQPILPDRAFDTTDRRLLLQSVALHMHVLQQKEIETEALQDLLRQLFQPLVADESLIDKAVHNFLRLIEERTGLLVARGDGVYTFSHLTFQEYLAALAIAARDDYVPYTLAHSEDTWWREVVLLEAGSLSLLSKDRTNNLISAIANHKSEPARYHNLVLASECLRDVGEGRVDREVSEYISHCLRVALETSPSRWSSFFKGKKQVVSEWIADRSMIAKAMVRSGAGYWAPPHGEPEWVEIPAGEFTMGSERYDNEKPIRQVSLPAYAIARVPITNVQYELFVKAAKHRPPNHWEENRVPKGLESHPVVNVSWYDAIAYCQWLSEVTGKTITLPNEAEWEKAARGEKDAREYPWGNTFDRLRCNSYELGINGTTPVGIFPDGASPYGVLDMSGNVWEW
ncbi:MAG: SUMF1/EgtB/PvdO family nonheme iron enzyme, partial [Anaerolineales bacterium]|nr:SUMF1/EgtB/PvdO family nonheme iron enzyme [Anaerolineales bacterium]